MKAFPTMLIGLALNYYYLNINTNAVTRNFNQVYNIIRNYFKKAKYKQNILLIWNKLTLKLVIIKNEDKLIEKCLEKLIDKLWHLQYGLDPELYTD